jgi:hypothetical protein
VKFLKKFEEFAMLFRFYCHLFTSKHAETLNQNVKLVIFILTTPS